MYYDNIIKLNLKDINIDLDKSYEYFDSNKIHTVELYLKLDKYNCNLCGSNIYINRGTRVSKFKHSTSLEPNIIINFHKRIFKCNSCGHYFNEPNPVITDKRSISLNTDLEILNELRDHTMTYKKVASKYGVSDTYVMNLFDTKVDIKRGYLPQVLSIDEIYAKRLTKSSYCCVLYSPQRKEIIDILPSRHKFSIINYMSCIPFSERVKVQFISIDMWESYRDMAKLSFPNAKICVDSFHVIKHLYECFDRIRIDVMKKFHHLKHEKSNYYWLFKKYNYFLKKNTDKLPETIYISHSNMLLTRYQVIDYMLSLDDNLRYAYDLKEKYRNFNSTANIDNARVWLYDIINDFKLSHINEYISFWKLLENWFEEIINSFNRINGFRISNGPIERLNKDIKTIFGISFGVTNFTRTRNKIMYSLNHNEPILSGRKHDTNKRSKPSRGSYNKQ